MLLRLAVGWHFFKEGTEKFTDPQWSSAGFLLQAKGPLAEFYHSQVPQVHSWRPLLTTPPDSDTSDEAREEALREWQAEYEARRAEAREAGQPEPFELPPHHAYSAWGAQIAEDWDATQSRFLQLRDLTQEQKDQALAALEARRQELLEYLEQIEPEIAEFQVALARVRALARRDEADDVPFFTDRVAALEAEALRTPQPWLAEVTVIEKGYFEDLREIYRAGQEEEEPATAASPDDGEPAEPATPPAPQPGAGDRTETSPPSQPEGNDQADPSVQENDQREGLPPDPSLMEETAEPTGPAPPSETEPAAPVENSAFQAAPPDEQAADDAVSGAASDADQAVPASATESADEGDDRMSLDDVFVDDKTARLELVDTVVTWLTLGVGVLLVVGLFTPLAGFAGAVFLASVISTQPPWVAGAEETYYQFVEMFSLLVLACTCAGRWAGLDYFFALLFTRGRRS